MKNKLMCLLGFHLHDYHMYLELFGVHMVKCINCGKKKYYHESV